MSEEDEIQAKILILVMSAMAKQARATYFNDSMGELELVAIETAKKIYNLFPRE